MVAYGGLKGLKYLVGKLLSLVGIHGGKHVPYLTLEPVCVDLFYIKHLGSLSLVSGCLVNIHGVLGVTLYVIGRGKTGIL